MRFYEGIKENPERGKIKVCPKIFFKYHKTVLYQQEWPTNGCYIV